MAGTRGTLGNLGRFSRNWSPGTKIRIEWGQYSNWNQWIEFIPTENPFQSGGPSESTRPYYGNKAILVEDFASNSPKASKWINLGSPLNEAILCIGNRDAWDTAWGIKDLLDNGYGDMGCNSPNWGGRGLFYGAGATGCWSGPQDFDVSKKCAEELGVRILLKDGERPLQSIIQDHFSSFLNSSCQSRNFTPNSSCHIPLL